MATRHSSRSGSIAAVGYLRRSSDKQEESLPIQKRIIIDFAKENGFQIVDWYVDDSISGDDESRPAFQAMVADGEAGIIGVIICRSQSRFSRLEPHRFVAYLGRLNDAGCRVVTVDDGELESHDFGKLLVGMVGAEGDNRFLRDLSKLTADGQIQRAANGFLVGQQAPFGFDRMYIDETGKPRLRVKAGEKCAKPESWRVTLALSDEPAKVAAVQMMFTSYANGKSMRTIAEELNRQGITTERGNKWTVGSIREKLKNRAYVGDYIWNQRRFGKYSRVENGKAVQRDRRERGRYDRTTNKANRGKSVVQMNDQSDWIVTKDAHPAIVSRELFEAVQRRMPEKKSTAPVGKPSKCYMLTGLVKCDHCGANMHGTAATRKKDGKVYRYERYLCSTYVSKGRCECGHYHVLADPLERAIVKKLTGALRDPENRQRLADALEREAKKRTRKTFDDGAETRLTKQLAELDKGIKTAARRILVADDAIVDDLTDELRSMKLERQQVADNLDSAKASNAKQPTEPKKLVSAALAKLDTLADDLQSLDRDKLRETLRLTIDRIDCRFVSEQQGKKTISRFSQGKIAFKTESAICQVAEIAGTGFEPATSRL